MTEKKATVKVHYFNVDIIDSDGKEHVDKEAKLEKLLFFLQTLAEKNRILQLDRPDMEVEDDTDLNNGIQLQVVEKVGEYWKLCFVKIRDESLPGKISTTGVYEALSLEPNEYIGEDMTIIYSPTKHFIGVQRNYYSVNISKVEDYLNRIQLRYDGKKNIFKFEPITDSKNVPNNALIRSVEISCLDLTGNDIKSVIENDETYGAGRVVYKLTVGTQKKDATLFQKIMTKVQSFRGNKNITALKVGYKEDVDSPVTAVDFLDNKIEDILKVSYSKIDPINYEKIYLEMIKVFQKRYDEL